MSEAAAVAKTEVRRIIDGMAPGQLDRLGLMAAIRALGDQLNSDPAAGTPGHPLVSVDGPAVIEGVAPVVEVGAYRIAAEAMLNALRHSGGRRCAVSVKVSNDRLVVEVIDDGEGIGADAAGATGIGLGSIRSRVERLRGGVTVGPAGGGGFRVAVVLPVAGTHDEGEEEP